MGHKYSNVIVSVSTKKFVGDDAVETELTIDFSNCDENDLITIAARDAVIKWQNKQRQSKVDIPTRDTYVVNKPGTRGAVDPIAALLRKTDGDIDKAIALLQAAKGRQG